MSAHPAKPDALIEAYVSDVMKRLPRKQRNDVGFELRTLLTEELRGRAADSGRLPDEAMTLDLLKGFGHPDDVAARYHPPGMPIIPANATIGFAWATAIGVGLQWAASLPVAISSGEPNWIGRWWVTFGLGAFWWPGFLVTIMMIAAYVRHRWPAVQETWKPKVVDRDHVNRPLFALGLAAALSGIGIWIAVAWWATTSTGNTPLERVFAFDADFLATRAPVVLLYWAMTIVMLVVVTVEGRWREATRKLEMALTLVCCAMLAWIALSGRVFVADATNDAVEGIFWLLIVVLLADMAWKAWRGRRQIRLPQEVAAQQGR